MQEWRLIEQMITMGVTFGPQHFLVAHPRHPLRTGLYELFLNNQSALSHRELKR